MSSHSFMHFLTLPVVVHSRLIIFRETFGKKKQQQKINKNKTKINTQKKKLIKTQNRPKLDDLLGQLSQTLESIPRTDTSFKSVHSAVATSPAASAATAAPASAAATGPAASAATTAPAVSAATTAPAASAATTAPAAVAQPTSAAEKSAREVGVTGLSTTTTGLSSFPSAGHQPATIEAAATSFAAANSSAAAEVTSSAAAATSCAAAATSSAAEEASVASATNHGGPACGLMEIEPFDHPFSDHDTTNWTIAMVRFWSFAA